MTAAQPYRCCSVCRRNHDEGRKHIFTKTHKSRLTHILSTFSKKVRSARRLLQKPHVLEGELEPGATIWCYCCQEEVSRHTSDGMTSIEWGGLLEHMASSEHHKKTRHWWWVNGADSSQLQTFILFPAEFRRYKELVAEGLRSLEATREQRTKKLADDLKTKEQQQTIAAMEPPPLPPPITPTYHTVTNQYGVVQNPTGWHEGQRVWGGGQVKYKPESDQFLAWPVDSIGLSSAHVSRRDQGPSSSSSSYLQRTTGRITVAAYGDTLTHIGTQELAEGEGNVHSGATPPWLRDDEDSQEPEAAIGPSFEEFLQHKERERQSAKNPRRVGADFHRKLRQQRRKGEEEEDDWLPSFGGVWNAGPRSHTKREFQSRLQDHKSVEGSSSGSQAASSTVTGDASSLGDSSARLVNKGVTGSVSSEPSKLPKIRPYVRRRALPDGKT